MELSDHVSQTGHSQCPTALPDGLVTGSYIGFVVLALAGYVWSSRKLRQAGSDLRSAVEHLMEHYQGPRRNL